MEKNNADVGRELDGVADKIDQKEIRGMFGIDDESLFEQDFGLAPHIGSFGRVFHGDTANAWRYTTGMLPGKQQRYLDHEDYKERGGDDPEPDDLSDLHLPPEE